MSLYYWPVVISVTYLVLVATINRIMDHFDRIDLDRLADPTPLPGELVLFAGAQDPAYELSPFPGEGIVTHNELDQYARHYQGLGR